MHEVPLRVVLLLLFHILTPQPPVRKFPRSSAAAGTDQNEEYKSASRLSQWVGGLVFEGGGSRHECPACAAPVLVHGHFNNSRTMFHPALVLGPAGWYFVPPMVAHMSESYTSQYSVPCISGRISFLL
jgi:hypothetical protein